MKTTLTILLLGLLLCGCSQKQASSAHPAINLVESGKDTTWLGGHVLHVTKRVGSSLEGITITQTRADGQKQRFTADTGTISPGSFEDAADENSVKIILHNVHGETPGKTGMTVVTTKEMTYVLHKGL